MLFPVAGIEVSPFVPPVVAFIISFFTSMGGVSGAFLLVPFQMSVLGFTSPAVSPTNLLFNIVAIPGGVFRYIREGRMTWPLAKVIIAGTVPGVLLGVYVRIRYLPDPSVFKLFVGCVLIYIGLQLFIKTARRKQAHFKKQVSEPSENDKLINHEVQTIRFSFTECKLGFAGGEYSFNPLILFAITLFTGVIGGAYGIGGGSIVAPFCIAVLGLPVLIVAGATLLSTFLTSIVGIAYYYAAEFLMESTEFVVKPDVLLGLLFGVGGLFGMYCGARAQKHMPEKLIKLILSILITGLAVRYILQYFL